eukprot:442153-Pyramimonas_sp.AAC.1
MAVAVRGHALGPSEATCLGEGCVHLYDWLVASAQCPSLGGDLRFAGRTHAQGDHGCSSLHRQRRAGWQGHGSLPPRQ